MHLVNGTSPKWLLSLRVKRKCPDQAEALCLLLMVLSPACAVAICEYSILLLTAVSITYTLLCLRPPAATGVVSAAPIRYKTDDRVDSNIVTAAQVAMLGKLNAAGTFDFHCGVMNVTL